MHNEIQIALEFLVSFLHNKIPKSKICTFSRHLTNHLVDRFQGHWYPERPSKGSAFRCLTLGKSKMDDVVKQACTDAGLDPDQLRDTLTSDVSIWVDPHEVSYRIGENGTVKTLINFAAPSNGPPTSALGDTPFSAGTGYDQYQDYSVNGGPEPSEGLVTYHHHHHQAGSPQLQQQHYYGNNKQYHNVGRGQHQSGRHSGGPPPPVVPYLALTPPPQFQQHHYASTTHVPKFMGGSAGPHAKYHQTNGGYQHHQQQYSNGRGGGGGKRGGGPPKVSSTSPPFYHHHHQQMGGAGAIRRGITFSPPSPPSTGYFNDSSSPDDFYHQHHITHNNQGGFSQQQQVTSSFPNAVFCDKHPVSSQTVYFNTGGGLHRKAFSSMEDYDHDINSNDNNTQQNQAQSQATMLLSSTSPPSPTYYNNDHHHSYQASIGGIMAQCSNEQPNNANTSSPPSSFDFRSNGLNNGLDIITNNLQHLLLAK